MAKYRKKAIVVTADIADTHQYITTLEGITEAHPGDYIVNGVDNEQWAVKPEWFKGSYRHLQDNKYQRKPQTLEAVQIDKEEHVSTPTGTIKGDKGDYKVTGTKGEQWFVKPDIFDKTYDKVNGGTHKMEKNGLQQVIDQIGMDAVKKSMGDIGIGYCDVHGSYSYDMVSTGGAMGLCPLCPHTHNDRGNGTSATQVEHYINTNPVQSLKNPQQLMNPTGI